MAQGAANWVEGLFPEVPVRQWALSLPMDQRLALAASGDLLRWLDDERAGQGGLVLLGARARGDPQATSSVR